ncbi:MAG: CyaY protein [Candidatus Azotimanducaceae bacterium]
MQESEFVDQVEALFMHLEDLLDEFEEDIDIDTSGGLLTVNFPLGTTIVLSKQIAQHEIWVAAVSGGFHLSRSETGDHAGQWYCRTTNENLTNLLNRVFTEQLGRPVNITDLPA